MSDIQFGIFSLATVSIVIASFFFNKRIKIDGQFVGVEGGESSFQVDQVDGGSHPPHEPPVSASQSDDPKKADPLPAITRSANKLPRIRPAKKQPTK